MGPLKSIDFSKMMPEAWRVFFRQRSPRPIQEAAMPLLVRGQSALLSSPTATGKSEAVFAPLYQRHVTFRRKDLSVVYVAPTKALANDMFERLQTYFGATSSETIQRYTGDHHEFRDPFGKFALLSTPEALDSLQLVRPALLRSVRAIICDEIHLLHGTARGQQLRSVIARTRAHANRPQDPRDTFQIAGMTATVRDQEVVALKWLGPDACIVNVGEPRQIEMKIIQAPGANLAATVATELRASPHRKILLFANTRNGAHRMAADLSRLLAADSWPVYLHVGILSRTERERIESAMRRKPKAVCVATSTLEVGIDIGDVDLVILCEPPYSISGFLQRIGRGNRRSERCVVWAYAETANDVALYNALLHCGRNGILDEDYEYDRPSVEFQQAVSLAWIGARLSDPLTFGNLAERSGGAVTEIVARDMVETGVLRNIRGALIPADEWMDEGDRRRLHSVIAGDPGLPLIDLRSGEVIGLAQRDSRMEGSLFAGSRLTSIRVSDEAGVYLADSRSRSAHTLAKLPSVRGRKKGLSRPLVWAMAELSGQNPKQWAKQGPRLITWGGVQYNRLLSIILSISHGLTRLESDAFAVWDANLLASQDPRSILDLATQVFEGGRIPPKLAESFRENTPQLRHLTRRLQNVEALRSVPWSGFLKWLNDCLQ